MAFCLMDGTALPAPFDPQATLIIPAPRDTAATRPEGLPREPSPEGVPQPPTVVQAAYTPHTQQPAPAQASVSSGKSSSKLWYVVVPAGVIILGAALFLFRGHGAGGNAASPQTTAPQTAAPQTAASSGASTNKSSETDSSCGVETGARSLDSTDKASFTITNQTKMPLAVYWLNHEGKREKWFTLQPGETVTQDTFMNHWWEAADADGKCLRIFTPPGNVVIE